jgi:predicted acylesterase/phospholipase RssA
MRSMHSVHAAGPATTGLGAGAEPRSPASVRHARLPVPPVVRQVLRETALLGSLYGVYSVGRIYGARHSASAFDNAHRLIGWERDLGLPNEAHLQHAFLQVPHLAQAANAYYAYVHFPLTALFLIWLSIRRPVAYKGVRSTLMALTGLALVGYMFFPVAPPRMLPELGWVDTGIRFGQSVYGSDTDSGLADQFAAMPSLHVGWAALIAIVMITVTRSRWRWLWVLHPVTTVVVVVLTANHYWLDSLVALTLLTCLLLLSSAKRRMRTTKSVQTGVPVAIDVVGLEQPAALMKGRIMAATTLIPGGQVSVPTVAFVLQGGGSLAAGQVGMLRALLEAGIRPDLVVGSSAGALNGVAFAQNPTEAGLDQLQELWARIRRSDIFPFSPRDLVRGLTGRRNGLVSPDRLRALLAGHIGIGRLEDAVIPVRVVTTDAATGRPAVLSSGPALPALLASAALPGIFPPVELGGRLLIDGGVAADIPILQAEESGATTSYVLPMGSAGPTRPARGAANNAFLATRHLLSRITADDVAMARGEVYVLPAPASANANPMDFGSSRQLVRDGYNTTRSWLSAHEAAA